MKWIYWGICAVAMIITVVLRFVTGSFHLDAVIVAGLVGLASVSLKKIRSWTNDENPLPTIVEGERSPTMSYYSQTWAVQSRNLRRKWIVVLIALTVAMIGFLVWHFLIR